MKLLFENWRRFLLVEASDPGGEIVGELYNSLKIISDQQRTSSNILVDYQDGATKNPHQEVGEVKRKFEEIDQDTHKIFEKISIDLQKSLNMVENFSATLNNIKEGEDDTLENILNKTNVTLSRVSNIIKAGGAWNDQAFAKEIFMRSTCKERKCIRLHDQVLAMIKSLDTLSPLIKKGIAQIIQMKDDIEKSIGDGN